MSLKIIETCVNCWACEPLCPNGAVIAAKPHFLIDAHKCGECLGDFEEPQCAAICPIEGAIIDALGNAINPAGSLTGIPPERWDAVRAEIAAR